MYSGMKFYMFRAVSLLIIRGLFTVNRHWYMSYRSWSKAVFKPVWHIPVPSVQWINTWWWAEELPETRRVSCRSKFGKMVYLVGYIIKKFVTMHGHINVKLVHLVGFIIKKFVTMHGHINVKLVHLVGFIIKKFVTMHGHINVKLVHVVGFIIKKFVTMHGHMNVKSTNV